MEHEQAGAEVSDALRAAKHWSLYQGALRRAEAAEATITQARALALRWDAEADANENPNNRGAAVLAFNARELFAVLNGDAGV